MNEEISYDNELVFKIGGKSLKFYVCILLIIFCSLIQLLSFKNNNSSNSAVVTIYLSIVILTIGIYKIGIYGVMAAAVSSFIFSYSLNLSWPNILINLSANTIQSLLIYLFLKFLVKDNVFIQEEYISRFKIILFVIGLVYIIYNWFSKSNYLVSSFIFVIALVIIYILMAIYKHNYYVLLFLLIVFIPNLLGALIGSLNYHAGFIFDNYKENLYKWSFTNSILLMSLGYIFIDYSRKILPPFIKKGEKYISIKFSSIVFYVSILFWNILIYVLYAAGWLNNGLYTYIFPWLVGNVFLIANLWYSFRSEIIANGTNSFKWFEDRAVVAEKNTQILIAVIAILLTLFGENKIIEVDKKMMLLFVLNTTFAIVSVGLIWIPKGLIKHMSAIKHIKTAFHLLTLAMLLLNIVVIINCMNIS